MINMALGRARGAADVAEAAVFVPPPLLHTLRFPSFLPHC